MFIIIERMAETILLVEDDLDIADLIHDALSSEGYVFVHAENLERGWENFERLRPVLVILDVGLPDGSGFDLCRRIRAHAALGATPVIMLTAKGELKDKMSGFDAGADHYLVKPIRIAEFLLWVRALLRRVGFADREGGVLRAEDCAADPQAHTVSGGGKVIKNLTRKEFELFYELLRRRPKVVSRESIMKSLWNTVLRDNTIEVHIRNLRRKLGPLAGRIVTVPGVGYKFE